MKLKIQDLVECAKFALKRDKVLSNKQINILAKKGNENVEKDFFWNWFCSKYGIPKYGERGFSAKKNDFAFYFFEDLIFQLKHNPNFKLDNFLTRGKS